MQPGKRTLTEGLALAGSARAGDAAAAEGEAGVHAAAASAIGGTGGPLPYLGTIQKLFGRHDVSQIRAHTDERARAGAQAMGAEAFATGDHVAFGAAPSLHTAAHEAAHVVQQRGGVQLKGGVGEVGDPYERHADAVADLVVQGKSAEHLLDQYAPHGATGAPRAGRGGIQMLALVKDSESGKLRRFKKGDKADGVIETTKLALEALNPLVASIDSYDKALAAEIRRERDKASAGKLKDIADVFRVAGELEKLEAARAQRKELDKAAITSIADTLSAAHVLLQSVELPDEANLYRDTITAYTRRLHALDDKAKLSYKDGNEGLALGVQITAQNRADYRHDVQNSHAWGGLAEAEVAANRIRRRLTIFRIDTATNTYRRVTMVGAGNAAGHNLLHLGNHYVAIPANIADGAAVTPQDGRVETEPDGNCMYEAIQICLLGRRPSAEERTGFIRGIRAHVAGAHGLSDDAVDTSIIAILAHGDTAGLGPRMAALVRTRRDDARIEQLDEKELEQITARFRDLEPSPNLDYADKARVYLAARKADPHSKATAAALAELEDSLARAQLALAARDHKVDPTQLELPMDWWGTVRAAVGEKVVAAPDNPFSRLAAMVVEFNRKAKASDSTVAQRLKTLDGIEEAFKNLEAPGGPLDKRDAAHEQARVAVFGFQTVELRKVRANLIRLYQLAESSAHRTYQPGGRPDMHYDVYAEGEIVGKGQRATPDLGSLGPKEKALVSDDSPKEKQEGLSAVALQRAYPKLFSDISKAPKYKALKQNVEYYDNQGRPWDQVAGHSFTKGDDNIGIAIARSVRDHLDNKPYPPKGTKETPKGELPSGTKLLPCGVVLDCTYLDHNDYTRMWSWMIQNISAADLRDRVVEINVPFAAKDRKDDHSKDKADKSNTVLLDMCRTSKDADEAMRIYTVSAKALAATCIPSIATDMTAILDGSATANVEHPVYRNHGGMLPNSGSYFLEYYATNCAPMPTGTDVRIVFDRPNKIFYVTGTHYRAFLSPYSDVLRNAFYRVAD